MEVGIRRNATIPNHRVSIRRTRGSLICYEVDGSDVSMSRLTEQRPTFEAGMFVFLFKDYTKSTPLPPSTLTLGQRGKSIALTLARFPYQRLGGKHLVARPALAEEDTT